MRDRLQVEETNYFFICKNCENFTVKFNFEEAFELNFRCPDCGSPLEAQDNQKIIELLKNKIALSQILKISIE